MNYVVLIYQAGFLVLDHAADCCAAYYGNFILFLLMYLMCTVLSNVCISRKAEKLFPYLKEKEGTSSRRGADGTVSEYPRHDDAQAWDGRGK